MFCKRKVFLHSLGAVVALLITMTLLGGTLQAQTDPGPRPVGTQGFFAPPATAPFCPGLQSARFPGAFTSTNPCIDVDQPPDNNGDAGAGNVVSVQSNLTGLWFQALTVFETNAVVGPIAQTGGAAFPGLGPSFNAISCFQCHSQPAVGGSSPGLDKGAETPGFPNGNPQLGDAPTTAQKNAVSSFIKADGPVREVRFPGGFAGDPTNHIDPVAKGAVAELFVIQGRPDAPPGCLIGQEPFQTELTNNNVIFRIPIPTFGEGFVENTDDSELMNNAGAAETLADNLGITGIVFGTFNTSGNDQTITRFGWKAQNKSMLIFSGEASNVEMGVTNENFPNERTHGNGQCSPNFEPEDQVVVPPLNIPNNPNLSDPRTIGGANGLLADFGPSGVASEISSNIENFAVFMRLNASPSQCNFDSGLITNSNGTTTAACNALNASSQRGQALFGTLNPNLPANTTITTIGCVLCHSDYLTTTTSDTPELNNVPFHPFSDFALHTMDPSLADGVKQGNAGPQQFRTAPLWGIGQRLFFLHDGRADDLLTAILDHCLNSSATTSEACSVIAKFQALPPTSGTNGTPSQEDILHFLRSL